MNQGNFDAGPFYVSAFNDPKFAHFSDNTQTDFTILPPTPDSVKKVDTQYVPGLQFGASTTVCLSMVYSSIGNHTIRVLADSQRTIPETDEVNNFFDLRLTVFSPLVDLVLTSFTAANGPAPAGPATNIGRAATFTAMIQNRGNKSSGPFTVAYFANRAAAPWFGDAPDSTQNVPTLPPNSSTTLTFTLPTQNAPRGGRSWCYVDSGNVIVESDKTNNISSAIWGLSNTPPVVASSATATANPTPASAGQTITFSVAATDPDGDPLTYTWYFGDGSTGNGATVTHVYAAAGLYNVIVYVNDGPFNMVQSTVTVNVLGDPSQIVDLGFVVAKSGYIKLKIPLPSGITKRMRFTTQILAGGPGLNVKVKNQTLSGVPGAAGLYVFTLEYLIKKPMNAAQVQYKYTVIQ